MGACGDVVLGERVITHARAGEAANMSQAGSKSLAVALYSERVGGEFVGIRHRSIFGSREPGVPAKLSRWHE